jgi:hypothetical protein
MVAITAKFGGSLPAEVKLVTTSSAGTNLVPVAKSLDDPLFGATLAAVSNAPVAAGMRYFFTPGVRQQLRRERTAGVQRMSRVSGARYDASGGDLHTRDRRLDAQPQERAWVWNYDAYAEAVVAAASL